MAQILFKYLPRGNMLEDHSWRHRHVILLRLLALHVPILLAFGLVMRAEPILLVESLGVPVLCVIAGSAVRARRPASILVTGGLTWCSAALVVLTNGSIEAHFHFFIIIGFIALYQDWVPFLWNILFTVVSHGVGSAVPSFRMFNHPAGQTSPWVWSAIHGAAVLAACVGLIIFWRVSEEDQETREKLRTAHRIAEAEVGRRRFATELLINLARRNQSMLYRQLEIINQLEEKERDPDALAELFKLDHLATRVRRNAESLLVLSGEIPSRVWSAPVPLREVIQAAIAETEDLDRVRFTVDERLAVAGDTVTDLTHLLAELTENAVRFSPPDTNVTVGVRPLVQQPGAQLVTIEDWGVGMPPEAVQETNQLLAYPPEVDLSVSARLGFHVVARLAQRHRIDVSVTPTPGSGLTAIVVLPATMFAAGPIESLVEPPESSWRSAGRADPYRAELPASGAGWAKVSRSVPQQVWQPAPPAPAGARPGGLPEVAAGAFLRGAELPGSDGPGPWDGWWSSVNGSFADNLGHSADTNRRNGTDARHQVVRPEGVEPPAVRPWVAEPPAVRPWVAEPPAVRPAGVLPHVVDAPVGQSPAGQSVAGQSPTGQSVSGQPPMGQPVAGQSPTGQPATGQPAVGEPPIGRPAVGEPSFGQPAVGERSFGQPAVAAPRAVEPEHPATPPPVRTVGDGSMPELSRRQPQSHLAPELLKPRPSPRPRVRPEVPDPRPASEALSRYQASRHAAQVDAQRPGSSTNGGA